MKACRDFVPLQHLNVFYPIVFCFPLVAVANLQCPSFVSVQSPYCFILKKNYKCPCSTTYHLQHHLCFHLLPDNNNNNMCTTLLLNLRSCELGSPSCIFFLWCCICTDVEISLDHAYKLNVNVFCFLFLTKLAYLQIDSWKIFHKAAMSVPFFELIVCVIPKFQPFHFMHK